ncbi:MAG: hypothetical protein L3J97_06580 [Thermoplasmata archaeon]|nr:hypothetical protein [Thermoplasmata archaeon]
MWSTPRSTRAEQVGELAEWARSEFPAEGLPYLLAAIARERDAIASERSAQGGRRIWRWLTRASRKPGRRNEDPDRRRPSTEASMLRVA